MTGFVKGERRGNVIRPAGSNNSGSTVDEFSSHSDIENADLDTEDLIVEELSGDGRTRIREREEGEHYIKVDPNSEYAELWFDDQIEELQEKHRIVNGKPTETPSLEEVYQGIKEDCRERNKQVAREKMAEEKAEAREFFKKGTKLDKEVSEMTGSEFAELMANANEGNTGIEAEDIPEYKETIRQIEEKYAPMLGENEPEPEIKNPTEELSDGIDAFREYENAVFDELADDMEKSDNETMYESVDENTKRVTTTEEEMKEGLRDHENEPVDYDVEIEQDTGETVVAVVSR